MSCIAIQEERGGIVQFVAKVTDQEYQKVPLSAH